MDEKEFEKLYESARESDEVRKLSKRALELDRRLGEFGAVDRMTGDPLFDFAALTGLGVEGNDG